MRRLFPALSALLLLLIAIPAASAHVTVTATAPKAPIPWDAPTQIPATVAANCAIVLAEYNAAGSTKMHVKLANTTPEWLPFKDSVFAWDMTANPSGCGSDGNYVGHGPVTITPGPMAPGLVPFNVSVIASKDGTVVEGGTPALVNLTIAYRGLFTAQPAVADAMRDEEGSGSVDLLLNASLNADSVAEFKLVTPMTMGVLGGLPEKVDIASPLVDNMTSREVRIPLTYFTEFHHNITDDSATIEILMHAKQDPSLTYGPVQVVVHFVGDAAPPDEDVATASPKASLPGPEPVLLLGAVAALAVLARRRRA